MPKLITQEELVLLRDVPKLLPKRPHPSTIDRWRLRGIRGVRLETVLLGGIRYTSREALERFFADSTAAGDPQANSRSSFPAQIAVKPQSVLADTDATRILKSAGVKSNCRPKEVEDA